jgi:hypothetical protein
MSNKHIINKPLKTIKQMKSNLLNFTWLFFLKWPISLLHDILCLVIFFKSVIYSEGKFFSTGWNSEKGIYKKKSLQFL